MKRTFLACAFSLFAATALAQGETRDRSTPPQRSDSMGIKENRTMEDQEYNRNDTLKIRKNADGSGTRNSNTGTDRNNTGTGVNSKPGNRTNVNTGTGNRMQQDTNRINRNRPGSNNDGSRKDTLR